MNLICEEYSNKEIAAKLNVSGSRSVESARERIQEKIGAKNMAGIVTYAIKNRIYCGELNQNARERLEVLSD
jgi:DNA-binding CsgD family transcriptional regulator